MITITNIVLLTPVLDPIGTSGTNLIPRT